MSAAYTLDEHARRRDLQHERAVLRGRLQLGLVRSADVRARVEAIDAELRAIEQARDARAAEHGEQP